MNKEEKDIVEEYGKNLPLHFRQVVFSEIYSVWDDKRSVEDAWRVISNAVETDRWRLQEAERERIAETAKTLIPKGSFELNIHKLLDVIYRPETLEKEIKKII